MTKSEDTRGIEPQVPLIRAPDAAGLKRAIHDLLVAAGLDPEHPTLKRTPERVSKLWQEEFLSGYEVDLAQLLSGGDVVAPGMDAVFLFNIDFHGLCPHHLLPYQGRAHVGYLPGDRIVGIGRIARLVNALTQRFTLQEEATTAIAAALVNQLESRGAGCILEARHGCLAIPGDRHHVNQLQTSALLGEFEERADLRQRLFGGA